MRSTLKTAVAGVALAGALVVGSATLVAAREASAGGHDRGRTEVESERPDDSHGRRGRRGADDSPSTTATTVDDSTSATVPGTDDAVGTPGDDALGRRRPRRRLGRRRLG